MGEKRIALGKNLRNRGQLNQACFLTLWVDMYTIVIIYIDVISFLFGCQKSS